MGIINGERKVINRSVLTTSELKDVIVTDRRQGSIIYIASTPVPAVTTPSMQCFVWFPTSTAIPDDQFVVIPNSITAPDPGRWINFFKLIIADNIQAIGDITVFDDLSVTDKLGVDTRIAFFGKPEITDIIQGVSDNDKLATWGAINYLSLNTVWFDISGNDTTGDGTYFKPFLTLQKAADYINVTFTPSATQVFTAAAVSAYTFSENVNISTYPWTNVYAPGNFFQTNNFIFGDNQIITVGHIQRLSGIGNTLHKKGSGHSVLNLVKGDTVYANQPLIFIEGSGSLEVNASDGLYANSASDFLLDTFTDVSGGYCVINAPQTRGRVETNAINFEVIHNYSRHLGGNYDLNANSTLSGKWGNWTGLINSAGALAIIRATVNKRHSDPGSDTYDPTASILIDELEKPFLHAYLSANQALSASPGTPNTIIFNTLEGSPYQMSLNAGTGEVTIKTNGVYEVESGLALDTSAIGQSREIYVYVNGSLRAKDTERHQPNAKDKQNANIVAKLKLKKGNLVKIAAWSDTAINVNGTATYKHESYIKITKIGNFA